MGVRFLIKEYYPEYYGLFSYELKDCIGFNKSGEEWGILGNFGHASVTVNGVIFNNTEQLFQMMKFRDIDLLKRLHSSNGLVMKHIAKSGEKNGLLREDWGSMIIDAMKFCLQTKYEQSAEFKETPEKTKEHIIFEDQTTRKTDKKTGAVKDADTWGAVIRNSKVEGPNLMGRLLMELRDNGKLRYTLPEDALDFVDILKQ